MNLHLAITRRAPTAAISSQRESQVQTLEELILALRQETSELRRRQNEGRRAVSAPIEILRNIFQIVCLPDTSVLQSMVPGEDHHFSDMLRGLRQARQTVASVCSRWRDVALQDSALWCVIPVEYVDDYGVPTYEGIMDETARAGARELSLLLITNHYSDNAMASLSHDLREALYHRIHSLSISALCTWSCYSPMSPILSELNAFPNLRTLRIGLDFVRDDDSNDGPASDDIDLTQMQHLREVVIAGGATDSRSDLLTNVYILAPMTCGITHLVLWSPLAAGSPQFLDFHACIQLINACRYLEKLDWSSGMVHPGNMPGLDAESQNHLTALSIAGDVPMSLIPDMHYPNLLKLRIFDDLAFGEDDLGGWTVINIHDLLASSKFPKLRHLDQRICVHSEHIVPFLLARPDLEELVLWHDIDATWVEGLTALSAPSTFRLPNLSRVWTSECSGCVAGTGTRAHRCTHPSAPHLDDVLRKRSAFQNPLIPFTVYLHPDYRGSNVTAELAETYDDHVTAQEGEYVNTTWYWYP